ncbi:hypothetical protein KCP73_05870 [Salmonella enterica subsp. enterica]|nr:hypothetical protein KCP73_05870 [Salmonella enterica subsp. enterica]
MLAYKARIASAPAYHHHPRLARASTITQLNATGQRLKTWLAEHDGIRVWRSELAVAHY